MIIGYLETNSRVNVWSSFLNTLDFVVSKESASFLNCMLQYEPQKRLSVDELYNHEFLRKNVKDFIKLDSDEIKK